MPWRARIRCSTPSNAPCRRRGPSGRGGCSCHGPAHHIAACEQIVAEMPGRPVSAHGGGTAFYRPRVDQVTMPAPGRFEAPELYYSTLFHELTHATGHAGRLNRATLVDAVRFGDTNYSKEELVAEMGVASLCGRAGSRSGRVTGVGSAIISPLLLGRHAGDPASFRPPVTGTRVLCILSVHAQCSTLGVLLTTAGD